MPTFILWTLSNIQGPSGAEELRFSNTYFRIDSGPSAGQTFLDSWETSSYLSFSIQESGYDLPQGGIVGVGGVLRKKLSTVRVVNNFLHSNTLERRYDYLFASDYDLSNVTVKGEIARTTNGTTPLYADFYTFFSGTLARTPLRDYDSVTWSFTPTASELDGPMLTEKFNGMAGYLIWEASNPIKTAASGAPSILSGDFTIQLYVGSEDGSPFSIFNQGLFVIQNGATELLNLYRDSNTSRIKMDVWNGASTDTYDFFSVSGYPLVTDMKWITVQWDSVNSEVSAWLNDDKLVDAAAISNAPSGTEDTLEMGKADLLLTQLLRFSAVRAWSRLLTDDEVSERMRPLDASQETDLECAYEFDDFIGTAVTDYSENRNHISLASGNWWGSDPQDSGRDYEDRIMPTVFGFCYSVPVLQTLRQLGRGFISTATDYVLRMYSSAVPLALDQTDPVGGWDFNHQTSTMDATSTGTYGVFFVPGQSITISGSTGYDGDYIVDRITPPVYENLRNSGDNYKSTVYLESPGWVSSSNSSATVARTLGTFNWSRILTDSPYYPASNFYLTEAEFTWELPDPITADTMGDPKIYATSPPSGYTPPDDLGNVVAQMVKTYGPKWDNTRFPLPVYGDVPYRVGYYASDSESTASALDEILKGCLTWFVEDGDGNFSLRDFAFPADVAQTFTVTPENISEGTITRVRSSAPTDIRKTAAIATHYRKSWTVLQDIPQTVDGDTRSFYSSEWSRVDIGAPNTTEETPIFETYENRKLKAVSLGKAVLRLTSGDVVAFDVRDDVEKAMRDNKYEVGAKITDDLSSVGLSADPKIIIGRTFNPGSGTVGLVIWQEES